MNLCSKNSNVCESEISDFGADVFFVMHINCRSLLQKCTQFCTLLNRATVPIVALTETWLNEFIVDSVHISGYSLTAYVERINLVVVLGFL